MITVADLALSRRLERCEAKTNAALIEARARLSPDSGAEWIECAGAYALFDGVRSPLTQTFCVGMPEAPAAADLKTIEDFLLDRGAEVFHEVSPLTGSETLELLVSHGYRPLEFTSIMFRPIETVEPSPGRVRARQASSDESDVWSNVAAEGWGETPELGDFLRDIGRVSMAADGMTAFLAELDGRAVGTGALAMHDGVALLAGASTIPSARNQGAQRALLEARLRHAAANGCELAMMGASPGSASQRNAERQGFRIAYTRIKWSRGDAEARREA
jgi:GNAT superfamily N-acetyltransferase